MFWDNQTTEFPEWYIEEENVYVLYEVSRDDKELESIAEELVERTGMDIDQYTIKKQKEFYGLYVGDEKKQNNVGDKQN